MRIQSTFTFKQRLVLLSFVALLALVAVTACSSANNESQAKPPAESVIKQIHPASGSSAGNSASQTVPVDTRPDSITVLVNTVHGLPDGYKPDDLVYPDVPFLFKEKIEKRMMRKEAAAALEQLFEGARKDGIYLAGVSAYRSQATQETLFNHYVQKDGLDKAKTYSAVPGHSEHQSGLAIDVSDSAGHCAAESCFAGTKEAEWLKDHAYEYGYIIRYPDGKENITKIKYEPWHIRYVGLQVAKEITERGITLEEYYDAVPVSK